MHDIKRLKKPEIVRLLDSTPDDFLYVHCASEGATENDDIQGLTPRVASISVRVHGGDTKVFDIPTCAQQLGITHRREIMARLDDIEGTLLKQFFDYVRAHDDSVWFHWRMNDAAYGFTHLENRYSALNGGAVPPKIKAGNRYCLKSMLREWYGHDFAPSPKMDGLRRMNGFDNRNFLTGTEELQAFKDGSYLRMSASSQYKVRLFESFLNLALNNKLKTVQDSPGRTPPSKADGLQKLLRPLVFLLGPLIRLVSREV